MIEQILVLFARVGEYERARSKFCFLVLASNPMLDVFFRYTPVLLPLYPYSVALRMGLDVHIGETSSLTPFLGVNHIRADFNQGEFIEGSVPSESVIIKLILLAPIILSAIQEHA